MNDELNHVLKLYREKRNTLDIHKTPEIFIQHTSSPSEVKQWLKAKGFSEYVVGKLGYLNGSELFSLSRESLEEFCGIEEGRRLLSQITIQRNVSGVSRSGCRRCNQNVFMNLSNFTFYSTKRHDHQSC